MSRLATIFAALADTVLAIVVGVVVPLAVATIGWFASGSYRSVDWEVLLTVALSIWTLGLNSAVGISITPEAYPSLGLTEPYGFVIAIAPLLVTAMIAWFGYRTGARILNDDEDAPWLAFAASVFAFPLLNFIAITLSPLDTVRLEPNGVLVGGTLLWAASLGVGLRVWEYVPWERLLADRTTSVLAIAGDSVRYAVGLITGLTAAATLLLLGVWCFRFGDVIGLMQILQLDVWSVIAVGLMQLLYLPTFIVWAMSWMLGSGFDLGVGSHAGPGGTDAGPLPVLPMFGLIPEGVPPIWWGIVAVPFAIAVAVVVVSRMTGVVRDEGTWWQRCLAPAAGSLLASLIMFLLAYLAQGGLGPGRLVQFGPDAGLTMLAALALFLPGSLVGALVPLETADSGAAPRREPARRDEYSGGGSTAVGEHPHPDTPLHEVAGVSHRSWRDRMTPKTASWRDDEPVSMRTDDTDDDLVELDDLFDDPDARTAEREAPGRASGRTDEPREQRDAAKPPVERRSRSPRSTSLRDALNRPDEPDIYADLD